MRTIKVQAKFEGVLPTGSFQNSRPGFLAEEEIIINENLTKEVVNDMIEVRQQELSAICYGNFQREAERAKIEKVKADMKNFRFYKNGGEEEYISVTSVIGFDKDWFVTDDELTQLAAQGNLIDAEFKNLIETGKYVPNKDLVQCSADRFIIKRGSKQLALDGWDIEGFLKKYPLQKMVVGKPVYNREWKFAGTPDFFCEYEGKKYIADIKRTANETDNFMQMSAYAKCEGVDVEAMMIIPMKPEQDGGNKCGWSKPIISQDIDKYFELFIYKRKQFTRIYGI